MCRSRSTKLCSAERSRFRLPRRRVQLTIPKGTSSGQVLRLKGKGVRNATTGATGDELVTVRIVLPDTIDEGSRTSFRSGARSTATIRGSRRRQPARGDAGRRKGR